MAAERIQFGSTAAARLIQSNPDWADLCDRPGLITLDRYQRWDLSAALRDAVYDYLAGRFALPLEQDEYHDRWFYDGAPAEQGPLDLRDDLLDCVDHLVARLRARGVTPATGDEPAGEGAIR